MAPAAAGQVSVTSDAAAVKAPEGFQPFDAHAFVAARQAGRAVALVFGAEWCAPCKELEVRTFPDPEVRAAAEEASLFYFDMTDGDRYTETVRKRFEVRGAPTTIFFDASGEEHTRRGGFIPPAEFAQILRECAARPDEG